MISFCNVNEQMKCSNPIIKEASVSGKINGCVILNFFFFFFLTSRTWTCT